jgi:hypothetical protein
MTKLGKAADGIAKTEVDHHRKCPAAGSDMRGLRQVFEHIHDAGDPRSRQVFASEDAAEKWFEENDPEGVAFEYEVIGPE